MRFQNKLLTCCISIILLLVTYTIVEFYFSEFIMIKLICIYVIVLLALSMLIEYIIEKDKKKQYSQDTKIDYLTWAQKIGKPGRTALYFFRKH